MRSHPALGRVAPGNSAQQTSLALSSGYHAARPHVQYRESPALWLPAQAVTVTRAVLYHQLQEEERQRGEAGESLEPRLQGWHWRMDEGQQGHQRMLDSITGSPGIWPEPRGEPQCPITAMYPLQLRLSAGWRWGGYKGAVWGLPACSSLCTPMRTSTCPTYNPPGLFEVSHQLPRRG